MKKILIVDDDHDFSSLTRVIVQNAGYKVLLCEDSQECTGIVEKEKPDLIIMDVMMPGMDGADVVKELKANPDTSGTPVIFLTGLVAENDTSLKREGLKVEDKHYPTLIKPFETEELLAKINELLNSDK